MFLLYETYANEHTRITSFVRDNFLSFKKCIFQNICPRSLVPGTLGTL